MTDNADRLDALQRIVEHETMDLVEQLRWRDTNCSGSRFQAIARRLFLSRVTKRATVLVPHPDGELMSDGNRYSRFYVPLQYLRPA